MRISEIITSIETSRESSEFLPTGFDKLDAYLDGGLLKQELVILGGFTGLGKSYVAGQIFWNLVQKGFKCAYFSLEISAKLIAGRLIGGIAGVKPTRVLSDNSRFTEKEYTDVSAAKMALLSYGEGFEIFDDVYDLREIAAKIKAGEYEFVVVDFVQNLTGKGEDEYTRLSQTAINLQKMAKHYNCCIMALSQLSNQAAISNRVEYKGSGGLAAAADLGFFLERGESSSPNYEDLKLCLKKNRRGPSGVAVNLQFLLPGGQII